ncbi:MAG: polyprenyl synthetase family protein [Kofleriaceae bacterium]|nr:polyprenyl synthetase family protein [Kofleriaceae bacterium]
MKQLAVPAALPALLDALARALRPGGTSALDPSVSTTVWRQALAGPAADFLARPGKQLRTSVVRAGWLLGGGAHGAMPQDLPLVIEILHAGSLIVDDVEDGSTERRGAPALHQVYGVPLAINTGSWMYFWALAELGALGLPPATELAALRCAISTLVECHQGQALDLSTKIADVAVDEAPAIVAATTRLKTGSLCRLAAEIGALAAGASPERRAAIARFGESMGIGLQMLDDLGSLTSLTRRAKGLEDLREGRPTWPWAWLATHRPFAWARVSSMARALARGAGDPDELIDELVGEVGAIGRTTIRSTLDEALADLEHVVGKSPVTERIAADLAEMEKSYG